ncbi:hypothetical protein RHGRI_036228 [Rhododendron griersonianum]|uniref:RING-type domain-containing protein n=1 Tax=Rhododendron griersonianum TaxID=479676 RepID=A0AAV6HMR6_9ERIC|nr:hypothetical protein RHGRI_036228 [Rhododendron griersonianum]
MRKSFKDSLKALEADIQHANTLALGCPRLNDGACLQLRLSYSPVAHLFLFLVQWADCQLAGTLGLLRVLIYMVNSSTLCTVTLFTVFDFLPFIVWRLKASSRSLLFLRFVLIVLSVVTLKVTHLSVIFPSLSQLQSGITDLDDRKQKEICSLRYSKKDDLHKGKLTEADIEREDECGICMEMNSKVVLPNCSHTLCMKCYQDWRGRSQSCPFCRDSLKRVNSGDLWISIDHVFVSYDSRFK